MAAHPKLYALIPMLGVISASALVSYIIASRLLAFSLFGLLSYVEPVLLLGVALLLGEGYQGGRMADLHPDLAGGDGAGVRRLQAPGAPTQGISARAWGASMPSCSGLRRHSAGLHLDCWLNRRAKLLFQQVGHGVQLLAP